MSDSQSNKGFSMIADIDGDFTNLIDVETPSEVPILPVRNMVVFPGVVSPILIGREASMRLVRKAEKANTLIGIVCQNDPDVEEPELKDLFRFGVFAKVVKQLTLPNGAVTAIVQGLGRLQLENITAETPYLIGQVTPAPEIMPDKRDKEWKTAIEDLRHLVEQYVNISDDIPDEASFAIRNISNDVMALNFVCSNMPFTIKEKNRLISVETMKERLFGAMKALNREINLQTLKADIRNKTREDLDEQQKNYFLQQQIKNLQAEIGSGTSPEKADLLEKAKNKKWTKEVEATFYKEMEKLDSLQVQSPDYNVQLSYLQVFVSLPWGEFTKDNLDLERAQRILDRDHYGMEKVKERILEYMAVLALRGDLKSPILCLYGPPGVGKTSLGKSIAAAMKRKYVRMSLGGLHDEAEIRGHRRTYVGAMPGRILKSIQKAG
ncbi:MAG: LON peptidase substrate-binding domain-containing protein, partial [Prevotella sp.]|nr:LON peptidase substrate-binding domain-containing protein [Prevotella sp.]